MISILGVFNADLKFLVEKFPKSGETLHGLSFEVQPGGKGFNQAVASSRAMLSSDVTMLTQLGKDNFAQLARDVMQTEGIDASHILATEQMPTGTAMIMVEETTAENMIVIAPGAASLLGKTEINGFAEVISNATLFMTNLEIRWMQPHMACVWQRKRAFKLCWTRRLHVTYQTKFTVGSISSPPMRAKQKCSLALM